MVEIAHILLLGPEWPLRALLRAELIEAGYDVVAIDAWPMPRLYREPGMTPRVAIVDLQGLPEPRTVLDELRFVMSPDHVLVIAALGTLTIDEIRQLGFHVVPRPTSVADVVAAAASVLASAGDSIQSRGPRVDLR